MINPHPRHSTASSFCKRLIFKSLRIDFNSKNNLISFNLCSIEDDYGLHIIPFDSSTLSPLHQVSIKQDKANKLIQARGLGEDPQILINISWMELFLKRIQVGFWFSTIFLCYSLLTFLLFVFGKILKRGSMIVPQGRVHRIFVGCGAIFWLLAILAYFTAESRHTIIPVPQERKLANVPAVSSFHELDLTRADGLAVRGRLYQEAEAVPLRGTTLLLHGNYPQGQLFPLYPVLAEMLARDGFRVMTIDFAGFGQSADSLSNDADAAVRTDLESEVEAALSYLKALPEGRKNLSIIGHSMGANPTLRVGLRDPDVASITMIGPPRRVEERFLRRQDLSDFWHRVIKTGEQQYGRHQLPRWYTQRSYQEYFLEHDIVYSLPRIQGWRHKPVYFLDGGDEPPQDLAFLNHYAQQVSAPCAYVTMLGVGHEMNVHYSHYEPDVMQDAVHILEKWCDHGEGLVIRAWYFFQNVLRMLFPFR